MWRADHDQELRIAECRERLGGKLDAGRGVLVAATDRAELARHRPHHGGAPHQVGVDAKALELALQPIAPSLVVVAVAQKRPIFEEHLIRHPLAPE
jgi:hypothetical protein